MKKRHLAPWTLEGERTMEIFGISKNMKYLWVGRLDS